MLTFLISRFSSLAVVRSCVARKERYPDLLSAALTRSRHAVTTRTRCSAQFSCVNRLRKRRRQRGAHQGSSDAQVTDDRVALALSVSAPRPLAAYSSGRVEGGARRRSELRTRSGREERIPGRDAIGSGCGGRRTCAQRGRRRRFGKARWATRV